MLRIVTLLASAALLAPAAAAPAAQADGLSFSPPLLLPHGDPNGNPHYGGGEPSLGFDPAGDGHVYVTAPQGIPSAAGSVADGAASMTGVAYWASADHGRSWPIGGTTGTLNGGGDSDVEVLPDHSVLVADLEAADAAICISTDFAHTFPSCDNGLTSNHQGPENDREWLTRGTKPGEVYLTYHDFAGGFPIIERSTDGGTTFSPCGTIIDPSGPAARTYTPAGGTLVSKPVVGRDGTIYVEFTTPDQTAPPVGASLNHLYMAVAKGGCSATTTFTDHVIYEDPGASLANIFQAQAIDGGGQLYVLAGGKTKAGQADTGLWLFTSTDGGKTWPAPTQVNPPELKANVFPALAGGPAKGEVALGWFGTQTSGDPNATKNQWRFYAAESYDGGQTFRTATVTPDVIHYGDICTQGIFCGLIPGQPGNRNLADFASIATDPANGCVAIALPGDPYNRPDLPNGTDNGGSSAYVSTQADNGTCLTAANAGKAASTVQPSGSTPGLGAGGYSGSGPQRAPEGSGSHASSRSGCLDRAAPAARFAARGGARTAARRRGVTLRGTASDRGCGATGRGTIRRVSVAIARRAGHRCRFLSARGGLGRPVPCSRPAYLTARGTSTWRIAFRHRLPRGAYVAYVRATDAGGNVQRTPRTLRFRVR
jgi:hypothetical protein